MEKRKIVKFAGSLTPKVPIDMETFVLQVIASQYNILAYVNLNQGLLKIRGAIVLGSDFKGGSRKQN